MRSNRLLGRRAYQAYLLVLALLATFLAVEVPAAHGGTFPGGNGLIVFAADQFAVDDFEIYTMNSDGSGLTQLTNTTGINRYPSWSADGTKIAFSSTRDAGNFEIYVMNADGTSQTRLTTTAVDNQVPSWSPDGAKIVFTSNRVTVDNPTGDYEIFVMNADGSGVTQLTFNTIEESSPSYSPDGTKIVFDRDVNGPSEIWVMNPDGTGQTQLTFNGGTQDVGPRWSPDGTKILWRRDFGGCGGADIWVMNADGTSPSPLICDSVGFEAGGTYSPDGTKMLFVSTRDFFGGFQKTEIYVANADGTGQTRITTTTYTETDADWQPLVNSPPDCSNVTGSPNTLWPPNHQFVPITITGVTDPDGDPLTIVATAVTQDEAVKDPGAGSGNTSPDATLSPLAVRAERNGNPKTPGNGRVYHISFTADDGKGGMCTGTVSVCVPHDQRPGATCVDGGPLFNSLTP